MINQNRNNYSTVNRGSPTKDHDQILENEPAFLESEELFESAKVKLSDKRYKEAIADFSKAL